MSATEIPFIKMNGLGNDFVVIDARREPIRLREHEIAKIGNRSTGIGFDQMITLENSATGADAFMRIDNADGGEVSACGNATRCIGWMLMQEKGAEAVTIETRAGLLFASDAGEPELITVDMGQPKFQWNEIPLAEPFHDTRAIELQIGPIDAPILHSPSVVSMGNPHAIFWVDDIDAYDLERIGPLLENHPMFPERANISLARVIDQETIELKVWERGVGLTKACGTAACAVGVSAARTRRTGRLTRVILPGGTLVINWRAEDDHVMMTGPVETEFKGVIDRPTMAWRITESNPVGRQGSGLIVALDVLTFGCRLNTVESETMKRHAEAAGLDNVILVNTCAVTGEAVRQAKQAIRRARRENPDAKILVTGCAAQVEPATFGDMAEVDLVIGNDSKLKPESYQSLGRDFGIEASEKVRVNDIFSVTETAGHMIEGLEGRTRAFVQVQNGCDHRCTFCIIPYGRGNSRSVPTGDAVEQVKRLVGNGYAEVVLTGVDITSWGQDLPGTPKLGRLVAQILKHTPDLKRLRISSIDSVEADEELIELIGGEARLMPHYHLSLQAGDDMILKRMKRRHLRDDAIAFCERVRSLRPDVVFGADIIAGFPTETEEMFQNSLKLVDDCGLTHLHVFPFSPRPGTPAARIPPVEKTIVKERAGRLREKGEAALASYLASEVGRMRDVLVEKSGIGRTEHFTLVELPETLAAGPGDIVSVAITGHTHRALVAGVV